MKKQLTLQKNTSVSFKIHIPFSVERKIRKCCEIIHDIEWSGVLFYTYTGAFNTNDLVIECLDILPMDVGTGSTTEFEITEDVIGYMVDNDMLDAKMGLIHSHHNMAAFFSGTDTGTLASEGTFMDNFVSLIVNNAGLYVAGITRKIKEERQILSKVTATSFDSDGASLPDIPSTDTIEYVEWFDLEIDKEEYVEDANIVSLINRLSTLKKAKTANKIQSKYSAYSNYSNYPKNNNTVESYNATKNKAIKKNEISYPQLDFYEDDYYDVADKVYGNYYNTGVFGYHSMTVDKKTLNCTLAQLVKGSDTYTCNGWFDIQTFIEETMEATYNTIFKGAYNPKFKNFADSIVDSILYNISDPDLQAMGLDEIEISSIYAYHMIEELEKYESNPYITEYINVLREQLIW